MNAEELAVRVLCLAIALAAAAMIGFRSGLTRIKNLEERITALEQRPTSMRAAPLRYQQSHPVPPREA